MNTLEKLRDLVADVQCEMSVAESKAIRAAMIEAIDALTATMPQAKCETCNDVGMIGGFVNAESGYQSDPCPDCAAMPQVDGDPEQTARELLAAEYVKLPMLAEMIRDGVSLETHDMAIRAIVKALGMSQSEPIPKPMDGEAISDAAVEAVFSRRHPSFSPMQETALGARFREDECRVIRADLAAALPHLSAPISQKENIAVNPVAYRMRFRGVSQWQFRELDSDAAALAERHGHEVQPLYLAPPAAWFTRELSAPLPPQGAAVNPVIAQLFDPARLPERDDQGYVFHPDYGLVVTTQDECDVTPFFAAAGLLTYVVSEDPSGTEGDDGTINWFKPEVPEGWRLAAIGQTDEGDAVALFVRPCAGVTDGELFDRTIGSLSQILTDIAIILKGPEPADTAWSFHDLPEMVRALYATPQPAAPTPMEEAIAAGDGTLHGAIDHWQQRALAAEAKVAAPARVAGAEVVAWRFWANRVESRWIDGAPSSRKITWHRSQGHAIELAYAPASPPAALNEPSGNSEWLAGGSAP